MGKRIFYELESSTAIVTKQLNTLAAKTGLPKAWQYKQNRYVYDAVIERLKELNAYSFLLLLTKNGNYDSLRVEQMGNAEKCHAFISLTEDSLDFKQLQGVSLDDDLTYDEVKRFRPGS